MNKIVSSVFALLAVVYCVLTFFPPTPFNWFIKILPILLLLALVYSKPSSRPLRLFTFGLLFSMMGDIWLAIDTGDFFIFGLGSFLVAHLFYMACLFPIMAKNREMIAVYSLYGVLITALLAGYLGDLLMPVMIYMGVLLAMGMCTLLSKRSNPWLIIGGASFIVSDSLIGINKFYYDLPIAPLWIMASYYFAQYGLTRGIFKSQQV